MEELVNGKIKSLIFDFDGTVSYFEANDHIIVDTIFGKNKIVHFIDKMLWNINRLDVIKNSMTMLKIRIWFYSLFSGKSYKQNLATYRQEYFFLGLYDLRRITEKLLELSKEYKVFILSNNEYSLSIENKGIKICNVKSKFDFIKKIIRRYKICFVVGNNLVDDILPAKKLNIDSVYIGRSKFVKILGQPDYIYEDIITFLETLKEM